MLTYPNAILIIISPGYYRNKIKINHNAVVTTIPLPSKILGAHTTCHPVRGTSSNPAVCLRLWANPDRLTWSAYNYRDKRGQHAIH